MRYLFLTFLATLILTACEEQKTEAPIEEKPPELILKEVTYQDLTGWPEDNLIEAAPAFAKSCIRIIKRDPAAQFGPLKEAGTYGDWQPLCEEFLERAASSEPNLQHFFENNFTPYQVSADKNPYGLFTGYYESSLRGSRTKQGPYIYPLYSRPDDLVMVQLGDFREDLKGRRIAGRVVGGNLKPYEERSEIVEGNWPHNDKVLVWVDNPVDAFFVQIQGSGLIEMADGSQMRIGYAGQNGHIYYAIGRELINRGHLTKENVSMQSIRDWLMSNPQQADEVMNTNRSYVFFRELKTLGEDAGPIGGEGLPLTPERSLAIDRSLLSYGLPLWVDIDNPIPELAPLQKMMIAQDTGGAIRGPVRGDVFWGHGTQAEAMAGIMKSRGRYWILLPKNLKLIAHK